MILNPFERKPSAILSLTHFFGSRCVACFTHGCVHLCVRTLFPPISPHSCATSSRTPRSAMGTTGEATEPVSKWQRFSVSLELREGAQPSLPPKGPMSTPLSSIPSLCLIWWGNVGIFKRYVISHPASHGRSLPREQTQESCMVSPGRSAAAEGLGKNREPFCSCGPTADATLTPGPAGATWPKTMKSYCVCCQRDGCWSDCMGQVCQGYLDKEMWCYIMLHGYLKRQSLVYLSHLLSNCYWLTRYHLFVKNAGKWNKVPLFLHNFLNYGFRVSSHRSKKRLIPPSLC